jgi:hypothetical protein
MNKVKTYIKNGDTFVLINKFSGRLPDQFYIEGAISLTINNIEIITQDLWDYIDQLWLILVDGAEHLMQRKHYMGYFPGQPVEVIFKDVNDVYAEVKVDSNKVVIEKRVLIPLVLNGALDFFKFLIPLLDRPEGLEKEVSRLEELVNR